MMLRVVTALREALDASVELTVPAAVKHMSKIMGLPTSGVDFIYIWMRLTDELTVSMILVKTRAFLLPRFLFT